MFATIHIEGTKFVTLTDVNGYYILQKIPVGAHVLRLSCVGYDTIRKELFVTADHTISHHFMATKSGIELKTVSVSAEKERFRSETNTSLVYVTPKQIQQLPSIGGQADLAQYLQVLPGVVFTGDQGGQLYIRGGSPVQNKVLLDGMTIYNPFHSIGLFSVFDTDILKSADVYTGGFGAEYGGRTSAIMNLRTREGDKKRFGGKLDVGTFAGKLLLEGPIKKFDEATGGSTSFILSTRTSYLSESSKIFYSYIDEDGLPYDFTDIYGKVTINAANGNIINLYGFRFDDKVTYKKVADFEWNSIGAGANFVLVPSSTPMTMEGKVNYSKYFIEMTNKSLTDSKPRTSEIGGFNVGLAFCYFIPYGHIRYGVEMDGISTDYQFFNSSNLKIEQAEDRTEVGVFAKLKQTYGKWIIEPGLRFQYYASLETPCLEPRAAIKYNLSDKLRLKVAGGLYSQTLVAANSERDVVNLFYGFVSAPTSEYLPATFKGENVSDPVQRSKHVVLGAEYDLSKHITLNMEGYIKEFTHITGINRNKIYNDNVTYKDKPDALKKDYVFEDGSAQGIDLSVKCEYSKVYLWLAYSLGVVKRDDGEQTYYTHFDRRHNLNMLASYVFGKNGLWQLDVRWNYGSGFPFTQTQGYYPQLSFGSIGDDYLSVNEQLAISYAENLNEGRLPDYHRLDVSLKRKFVFGIHNFLDVTIGVTNVYDYNNIFYVDRTTNKRVDQLPLMPSAGVCWSF